MSLQIISLDASPTSALARLRVPVPAPRLSKAAAQAWLTARPSLAAHACQDKGVRTFGETITGASPPHLVEHLAIDLLVEAHAGCCFTGATTWEDGATGLARVRLSVAGAGAMGEGSAGATGASATGEGSASEGSVTAAAFERAFVEAVRLVNSGTIGVDE